MEALTKDLNDPGPQNDKQVDERDLLRQASAGDRRAFASLYDRHVQAIYRYAYFRLRIETEAEDVTSEVFHRALVAVPRFEPRRPFLAFLYTIARNVLADRMRRERPMASYEDALAHPSDAPGPDELATTGDDVRRLRAAIGQLTSLQQEVIVLRFIEGRSTKETAIVIGKRESTVRGIQMRALTALRGLLGDEAP